MLALASDLPAGPYCAAVQVVLRDGIEVKILIDSSRLNRSLRG